MGGEREVRKSGGKVCGNSLVILILPVDAFEQGRGCWCLQPNSGNYSHSHLGLAIERHHLPVPHWRDQPQAASPPSPPMYVYFLSQVVSLPEAGFSSI